MLESNPSIKAKNEYYFSSKPPTVFARIVLFIVTFIAIYALISATIALILSEFELRLGLLILYIIFWVVAVSLIRALLWNLFGKEIVRLQQDSILYIADYKYFRDGSCEISTDNIEVSIIEKDSRGYIRFSDGKSTIQTVSPMPVAEMEQLKIEIEILYKKK